MRDAAGGAAATAVTGTEKETETDFFEPQMDAKDAKGREDSESSPQRHKGTEKTGVGVDFFSVAPCLWGGGISFLTANGREETRIF